MSAAAAMPIADDESPLVGETSGPDKRQQSSERSQVKEHEQPHA